MSDLPETRPFEVVRELEGDTITLRGEDAGDGVPLVLLHGLSADRRNVLQGSKHLLRRGYRLVSYDARGHGSSDPPPNTSAYEYADLVGDLELVLADRGIERPVLIGSSMGAATAMAWTLDHPDRVPALVQVTPAFAGVPRSDGLEDHQWERFADVLESGGIDAFVEIAEPSDLPERWRENPRTATRQRLERHQHLEAIPNALRTVPRSIAFHGIEQLEHLEVPTLVVGSRDDADGLHPLEIAQEYARRLPRGELLVEEEGESPIAWSGGRLSKAIDEFLKRVGVAG
jgi:pimeloyl-ACP methyl ester carboxylesterase